jgi:hypothetical protein
MPRFGRGIEVLSTSVNLGLLESTFRITYVVQVFQVD